ncbi:hypothetical protein [Inediibacterium massiliense]|uniref:hypothetical protein n=1 Tax=Inediibacterium massiliense TaxID=1658111 RepID=UPI0006B60D96|nr:hypothetical protein [Inediibacterium massiliense]
MKLNRLGIVFLLFGCIFSSIIINVSYYTQIFQIFNENIAFIFLNIGFTSLGLILIIKDLVNRN